MAFLTQTWTLATKNLRIIVLRNSFTTMLTAVVVPIILASFLSMMPVLLVPRSVFGIGAANPIRSLHDALAADGETVVFVNGGHSGGDIDRVIDIVAAQVTGAGKNATRLSDVAALGDVCPSSLRGVTRCFGAVVFYSSPTEGGEGGGVWSYSLRADAALGNTIDTTSSSNSAQIYTLPLQRAVDSAIASLASPDGQSSPLPERTDEYPFTTLTAQERTQRIRQAFQSAISNYSGVSFLGLFVGVTYHAIGFITMERESGVTQLLDSMMHTNHPWEAQAARFLSYYIAFFLVYAPGWIITSVILARLIFDSSNVGAFIVYFVLFGMASISTALLSSPFIKRSRLSGIAVLAYSLLGILAQSLTSPSTATATVLSLLFAPCNMVLFVTWVSRWENKLWPLDLRAAGPDSPWTLPGIVLWVFLIIQIFTYPLVGAYLERAFHGTATKGRSIILRGRDADSASQAPIQLVGFTKVYMPSAIRKLFSFITPPPKPVVAVDDLTLSAERGQILVLLGTNGSGKSTTLDCIAGISSLTKGSISIDTAGGLGIAPQKHVFWEQLTVFEHIRLFNRLKSPQNPSSQEEIENALKSVDLGDKMKVFPGTLSGGQKKKLQLGMMLTGGSAVCCLDEVSSSIDPLSRRKIWDILLAERGKRTIIMTTHFLDEADLLADKIAILSKGRLQAEGPSAALKDLFGAGYRIQVSNDAGDDVGNLPEVEGVAREVSFDTTSYVAKTSADAAQVIRALEAAGIHDYKYSGPTVEDVFLTLNQEMVRGNTMPRLEKGPTSTVIPIDERAEGPDNKGLELLSGQPVGYGKQILILFVKRCTILKTNWLPYVAALVIPIVAAGLATLLVKGQDPASCAPSAEESASSRSTFADLYNNLFLVAGPSSKLAATNLSSLFRPVLQNQLALFGANASDQTVANATALFLKSVHLVDSIDEFNNFILQNRKNVTPAGWWLGDASSPPTVAYMANINDVYTSVFGQNALDILLSNVSIATTYSSFETLSLPSSGSNLQLLIYVSEALCLYPAFFSLYPTIERLRHIRGLQYSNGVRSFPLWAAHFAFDFIIVLVSTTIITILFATLSNVWYHIAYLFVILMLYGAASTLLAYVVSLFSGTQLASYGTTAAFQGVGSFIYLILYLVVITYSPASKVDGLILLVHFILSIFLPIGSVIRAMLIALNLFSTSCSGHQLAPNPGAITLYGGPILYLVLQSLVLFGILLRHDSGSRARIFSRRRFAPKSVDPNADASAISDEEAANAGTTSCAPLESTDGLRVEHLTKQFGKSAAAVEDVTLRIPHGEVFALLGPNGAGKSVTVSMIRGDIQPSRADGGDSDVFVENTSVRRRRVAARSHMGVCPQVDAIDSMTVVEHLRFYAKIRGIPDVEHNVRAVLRAVGLDELATRPAHALSGGNKRKLSLGIALVGNPSVVLLDEPSSGLDAAAKRNMWHILRSIIPGRSILLTTHSMEEADVLATRAGILAKRMLVMDTTENLRQRFGDTLNVHIVSRTAPHSTPDEMESLRQWILQKYPGAEVERNTYHGQMRFSVSASTVIGLGRDRQSAVGQLVIELEGQKEALGIKYYSVSPTTLDQVFLNIVGQHNVDEELGEELHRQ